jgi:hypothetical protein
MMNHPSTMKKRIFDAILSLHHRCIDEIFRFPHALCGSSRLVENVIHPNDSSHLDTPELKELASLLDDRGHSLRDSDGLEARLFESSCGLLSPPETFRFRNRFVRVAAAACLLIVCALSVRFLSQAPVSSSVPEAVDFSMAFDSETSDEIEMASTENRENLILSILEARADVGLSDVDLLESNDPVSIAFAPILGSAGFGFDDLETEIKSIEGIMGH